MLIATFSLPPEAVALERTLANVPDLTVEAERVAAHSTEWTMPCLWVATDDFGAVDDQLRADPSVAEIVESEEFAEEKFYQLEWAEDVVQRIDDYLDQEGSILAATTDGDAWELRIRFSSRDQFEQFRARADVAGSSIQLLELVNPGTPHESEGPLTAPQREALVAAMERGYFEVPRQTTAEELAAHLGITQQALSERLRRGMDNLVASALTTSTAGSRGS